MRTMILTLDNDWKAALTHAGEHFKRAWKTGEYQGEYIGFATPALLFKALSPRRWEILDILREAGHPLGMHELANKLFQTSEETYSDIQELLNLGLLEQSVDGKLTCPFDEIRAEFTLKKVA